MNNVRSEAVDAKGPEVNMSDEYVIILTVTRS